MESLEASYLSPNRGRCSRNTHVIILCIRYIYIYIYIGRWGLGVWVGWGILPLQLSHLWLHTTLWPRLRRTYLPTFLCLLQPHLPPPPCSSLHEEGKVLLQILPDYRAELWPGRPAGRQSLLLYSLAAIKLAIKLM
jgi:hypothetical protein